MNVILLAFLSGFAHLLLVAPTHAKPAVLQPLFASHEPIDIQLTADWGTLARDRQLAPPYYEASIQVVSQIGSQIGSQIVSEQPQSIEARETTPVNSGKLMPIKVRPRGKSRRDKETCAFPPLRLNFSRKQTMNTLFAGQDKLKLVTHCAALGNKRTPYNDRLHSEYLLYRIFNLITPNSFQVRRFNVSYINSKQRNKKASTQPAFAIEHKSALAARVGAALATDTKFTLESLDAYQASVGALFAYFAGNTDYSFTRGPKPDDCCHNSIALRTDSAVLPIPYDFDSTGFVDPPYALPATQLRLRKVTQRLYRGFCTHHKELDAARDAFLTARMRIETLIKEYPQISESRRKKLTRYTAEFFSTLDNPALFDQRIRNRCRS